jgi:prefoldin alpha subunit
MNEEQYKIAYQVEQLQKIIESIDAQLNEVVMIKESLENFNKLSGKEEILFPLANGIFASGKLVGERKLKMNVGNNVVVEKTVDEAMSLMQRQYDEINNYKQELLTQLDLLLNRLQG